MSSNKRVCDESVKGPYEAFNVAVADDAIMEAYSFTRTVGDRVNIQASDTWGMHQSLACSSRYAATSSLRFPEVGCPAPATCQARQGLV